MDPHADPATQHRHPLLLAVTTVQLIIQGSLAPGLCSKVATQEGRDSCTLCRSQEA